MSDQTLGDYMRRIDARLSAIERAVRAGLPKGGYSVADVALRMDLATWTVRDWCRTGRIRASKNLQGEWVVLPDELARLERDGANRPADVTG